MWIFGIFQFQYFFSMLLLLPHCIILLIIPIGLIGPIFLGIAGITFCSLISEKHEFFTKIWIVPPYYCYKGTSINHVDSWGQGVSQMTIIFHKPYSVKVATKGVKYPQKFDHVVYGWPHMSIDLNGNEVKKLLPHKNWRGLHCI